MSQVDLASLTRQVGDTALVTLNNNQSVSSATKTKLLWEAEDNDDLDAWDSGTPSRLTVPVGVTRVVLQVGVQWQTDSTGFRDLWILKNNGSFAGQPYERKTAEGNTHTNISSPVLPVVAGDYFQMSVYQDSGGTLTVVADAPTYFALAALG